MVEDTKVVSEQTVSEPTQDSSVEEIMTYASNRKEQSDSEPTSDKEVQPEPSGEDVKTQSENTDSEESGDGGEEKSIPYKRFKQVLDESKSSRELLEQLKQEQEQVQALFKDPEVSEFLLKKQGLSDDAITKWFEQNGIQRAKKTENTQPDFDTVEGWQNYIKQNTLDMLTRALQPIASELNSLKTSVTSKEVEARLDAEEGEAKKIAKEVYGIEYGVDGKDNKNINTAVGIIDKYLSEHPEDNKLGYIKLLHLAMAQGSAETIRRKAIAEEKERQEKVKKSVMEGHTTEASPEVPDKEWSVAKILEWLEENGK